MIKGGRSDRVLLQLFHSKNRLQLLQYFCPERSLHLKNHLHTLSKLFCSCDLNPGNFLDETDFDSSFYHGILDFLAVETRPVRLSKDANKNSFTFKVLESDSLTYQ